MIMKEQKLKPKKKKRNPDDKEQSARFIEMAEQVSSDKDEEQFESACRTILKPKNK
jgi:hypothetical protein